jgi:hypothetical protein
MFTFQMRLLDGSPADPPQFVSAVPNWSVGDRVRVGTSERYVIVRTEYDEERDETAWTVEPIRDEHSAARRRAVKPAALK